MPEAGGSTAARLDRFGDESRLRQPEVESFHVTVGG